MVSKNSKHRKIIREDYDGIGPPYKLYDIEHKNIIKSIVKENALDLVFLFWRGSIDDDTINFKLRFSDFFHYNFYYQAIQNLANIRVDGHVVELFDRPKWEKKGEGKKHVHLILVQLDPPNKLGVKVYESLKKWGFADKLNNIPRKYYRSPERFIAYFKKNFLFEKVNHVPAMERELRKLGKKLDLDLPREGSIVYNEGDGSFMRFKYIYNINTERPYSKVKIASLEASIYCNLCHSTIKFQIKKESLMANKTQANYEPIWCKNCKNPTRYFIINHEFTNLSYKNKYPPKPKDTNSYIITKNKNREFKKLPLPIITNMDMLKFAYEYLAKNQHFNINTIEQEMDTARDFLLYVETLEERKIREQYKLKFRKFLTDILNDLISEGLLTIEKINNLSYNLIFITGTKKGFKYMKKNSIVDTTIKHHRSNQQSLFKKTTEKSSTKETKSKHKPVIKNYKNMENDLTKFYQEIIAYKERKYDFSDCVALCITLAREYNKLKNIEKAFSYLTLSLYYNMIDEIEFINVQDIPFIKKGVKSYRRQNIETALKYFEKIRKNAYSYDKLRNFARIYNLIGNYYLKQKDISKALRFYLKSRNFYGQIRNWKIVNVLEEKIKDLNS